MQSSEAAVKHRQPAILEDPVHRTSLSHPLQIAGLSVGANGGNIGVTFAPGKHQKVAMTGSWCRDLELDLASVAAWGCRHMLSLIEPWEFDDLEIGSLPERARAHGLHWHGLPIRDGEAPDAQFLDEWRRLGPVLTNDLLRGDKVVVHCKGGLGRAGTVASMLLLESRSCLSAEEAMARVRSARPGAVETAEQERFLLHWASRML